jgi:hypothetical protein
MIEWYLARAPPSQSPIGTPLLSQEDSAEEEAEFKALLRMRDALQKLYTNPLRTQRVPRYYQGDFPATSFWMHTRENRDDRVFMRFLGLPTWVFDALCVQLRPRLAMFDLEISRPGPRTRLDFIDAIAVYLRHLQILCRKRGEVLEIEFSCAHAFLERAIAAVRHEMVGILRKLPAACVCRSSLEDLQQAWTGVQVQYGKPPWATLQEPFPWGKNLIVGELMDGTAQPVLKPGNQYTEAKVKSQKGHILNHVFNTEITGLIVDYIIGTVGAFNDSRLAATGLTADQQNPLKNTFLIACGYDNGWSFPLRYPLPDSYAHLRAYNPDEPFYMRPAAESEGAPCAALVPYYERCSAWLTKLRQCSEMTNGGLQKNFPCVLRPVRLQDAALNRADVEVSVRLFNLRTRLCGWNQVKTLFLRHSNANFAEQLRASRNFKQYMASLSARQELIRKGLYM